MTSINTMLTNNVINVEIEETSFITDIGSGSVGLPNDATITVTAGTGLTGGGAFTTDQGADETVTVAVDLTDTAAQASTTQNGFMTSTDKTKLDGVATGAEVNVQANWSTTDNTSDAFINNKPDLTTEIGDLTDVPGSFGQAGQVLQVNTARNALEYVDASADTNDTSIGIVAGTGLTGGETFTTNQATAENITLNLDTTRVATSAANGLMLSTDKTKLDAIPSDAISGIAVQQNAVTSGFGDSDTINFTGDSVAISSSGSVTTVDVSLAGSTDTIAVFPTDVDLGGGAFISGVTAAGVTEIAEYTAGQYAVTPGTTATSVTTFIDRFFSDTAGDANFSLADVVGATTWTVTLSFLNSAGVLISSEVRTVEISSSLDTTALPTGIFSINVSSSTSRSRFLELRTSFSNITPPAGTVTITLVESLTESGIVTSNFGPNGTSNPVGNQSVVLETGRPTQLGTNTLFATEGTNLSTPALAVKGGTGLLLYPETVFSGSTTSLFAAPAYTNGIYVVTGTYDTASLASQPWQQVIMIDNSDAGARFFHISGGHSVNRVAALILNVHSAFTQLRFEGVDSTVSNTVITSVERLIAL